MKTLSYEKHCDQENRYENNFRFVLRIFQVISVRTLAKLLENIGTKLLKIFTIGVCPRYRESGSAISETLRIMSKIYDAAFLFL